MTSGKRTPEDVLTGGGLKHCVSRWNRRGSPSAPNGEIANHADGFEYLSLTPGQLSLMAGIAAAAEGLWRSYFGDNPAE